MLRLHGYFRSSAAYRCRIAFNLKRVDYEFRAIHLRRNGGEQRMPGFRALNPQGLVPVLEVGGQVLTQSLAIIEWLDETHPEPPLLPEAPVDRAKVRAFAQAIACDIHPLHNLRVLEYLRGDLGVEQAGLDKWCRKWIGEGLAACEAILAVQPREGRFCFGDFASLADVCLAPQLHSAARFGVELDPWPRLRALKRTYSSVDAFVDAHPDNQPDSEA